MKGKRSFKRFLAVIMAVVFTVTGITFTPKSTEVKASTGSVGSTWVNESSNGWKFKSSSSGTYDTGTSSPSNLAGLQYTSAGGDYSMQYLQAMPSTALVQGKTYNYDIELVSDKNTGGGNLFLEEGTDEYGSATRFATASSTSAGNTITLTGQRTMTKANPYIFILLYWTNPNQTYTITKFEVTEETTTSDGYNDCTVGGFHDFGNGWQYQVDQSAGYRYGTYHGKTFHGEIKNRHSGTQTVYFWTPSGSYPLSAAGQYDFSITFYSTAAITGASMETYWSSVATGISLGNITSGTHTLTGTFTASNNFSGVWQLSFPNIPAGVEFGITSFSITSHSAATPLDVQSVSASSTDPNEIDVSWIPNSGTIPNTQRYEVYLDNAQSPSYTTSDSTTTSTTLTGVAKGSHTVTVKAKIDTTYASAAGVTSSAVTVHDPAPVAPASVTAQRSTTVWNGARVRFTADASAPAGQTYSIEVGGVEIESNASPNTWYNTTVSYGTGIAVDVIAHNDGTTATASTTVDVPEYKPISSLNGDTMVNTTYGEYYSSDADFKYKLDSSGNLVIKNINNNSQRNIILYYKTTKLTTSAPYYVTYSYSATASSTASFPYGVFKSYDHQRGTKNQTTVSGNNTFSFVITPTSEEIGNDCYAYARIMIPSNEEFTITGCTVEAAASAVNVDSVTATSTALTPNTVVASWVEGSNPPAYQNYEVSLLDSNDSVVGQPQIVPAGTTTVTFSNVNKGTGYKINVKAKVDETYATAAGVTSSAVEVHDPAPVAPASVTATRSTTVWNGVNVSFAADASAPAGQTYSIVVDGTTIENNASPGTTYSGTVSTYGNGKVVEVIAHNDGTTASTTTTVDMPEYKPFNLFNSDGLNTDYQEFYGDHARVVYKIDSNGDVHLKNTDGEAAAGMNFIYKKYGLTSAESYLVTYTYTSDTAGTQNVPYGVFTNNTAQQGSMSHTTSDTGTNTLQFMVEPTAEQVAANAKAYFNWTVPAGAEVVITGCTLTTSNPPEDVTAVGVSNNTPNQIGVTLTKPSPSQAPTNQVYEIYLTNTSTGTTSYVDSIAYNESSYTITNVPKGNYTVTVKAKVASTYASAGVTSSAIDVHDPAPVAPASVTASETSNWAYSIDVSFAAGSNPPAGQTYSIAFVDSGSHEYEVKAEGTAVPGTTYTIKEMNGAPIPVGTYTVKVYAHNDGTTAVTTTTATVQWNRAANTWNTTKIGDWEFFGTFDGTANWGQLGYKGSNFDNMQVKAINPSGGYTLQMRIANEDLYAGLVDGKVYDFSLKFKSTAAGTVKWTQHYYQNEQTLAVTDYSVSGTVNEMQSTFKYDQAACEAGETPYFNIELSTLPQGAVLYDFDLDIDILDWQPLAANETVSCGTGTALYSDGNANSMAYYNGSNTSWSNVRVKHIANALPAEWAYVNSMNIDNATLYKINGTSMQVGHKYRMTMTYSAPGTLGGRLYVEQNGCSSITGSNYDTIDGATGEIVREFVYDDTTAGFRVFYGGMDNGVEVTNIQFTFVEIPREVVGLNATSNSGDKLTAAWADPVSGLSQTYIVSLYDAAGTTPISGQTDIPVSAKNYTFTGLDANTTYTVKVVSTLGAGNNSAAVSTTGTTSEWIQMGNGVSQATTDGKANIYTEWGNLAYYYNSLGSINTLQLKRTSGAEADENYWWYYKVEQTNANAYSTLVNGHRYTMTVSYNTNAEATGTIKLKQNFGEAIETKHNVVAGRTGENKDSFTVDFVYDSSYGSNLTELMLGGLGNGTIISNIEYSFVEQESWDTATNDEWVDVGDYAYLAKSAEDDDPALVAQYSTSAGYPLSIKGNKGGWQYGGRYRVGTRKISAKPNSAYNYTITFNRSNNPANSTAYLIVDFGTGSTQQIDSQTVAATGSANITFTGKVNVPNNAQYMRIYGQFTWEGGNEKFSVVSYTLTPIAEFRMTNINSNVVADWSSLGINPAKLVYTSEGQQETVQSSSFVDSTYTFSGSYADNGSEVLLLDSNDEILARVVAFADLTITKVFINRPDGQETDGPIHANTNNTVNVFVKNIGVARANSDTVQDIYVKVSHDDWYNHSFDPGTVLAPNQEKEELVYGLRYDEPGPSYAIEATVNDGYVIMESDFGNNSMTKTFAVETQIEDDTAVLGFQLNTNQGVDGPSEFNPSYRAVCRASKRVYPVGGPENGYAVTNYGFIYAKTEDADMDDPFSQMRLSADGGEADTNEFIKSYEAQSTLNLEWTTKTGSTYNSDNSYFYALTMFDKYYTTDQYDTNYTYRSYLQYRDGNNVLHTVYPKDIYSASLYEIAEDLYKYEKMPTKSAHDFLYDNVLNIVSMKYNWSNIVNTMLDKMWYAWEFDGGTDEDAYIWANYVGKDMYYSAVCADAKGRTGGEYDAMIYRYKDSDPEAYTYNGHTYTHQHEYRSIRLDKAGAYDAFLTKLNNSRDYSPSTPYSSINEWIYNEIDHEHGFYKKVAYEWDTNLDKDYGTE